MGQAESFNSFSNTVESFQDSVIRQAKSISEISSLTYEQFLDYLSEFNSISRGCMDSDGKQLVFVVKKGSDSSILWKGTVKIICLKYDTETKQMESCRILNLAQFLKIFKTIKNELNTAQQIDANEDISCSNTHYLMEKVSLTINDNCQESTECCICLERKQEITLPCTHSYCQQCITLWNVNNNTCPVCREVLINRNEEWILSNAPNSAEINEHIATCLMDIVTD
ncbi:hypothetical protein PGB90_008281 [Kerria lacca]